jgi:hypothetical protein
MMPDITGMDLYREIVRVAPRFASRIVLMTSGVHAPRARAFVEGFRNDASPSHPTQRSCASFSVGEVCER